MQWWHQTVATLGELLPGGVLTLGFISVTLAALVAVLWYYWPDWLPSGGGRGSGRSGSWRWQWPQWLRIRWRWPFQRGFWRRLRLRFRWSRLRWRWRRQRSHPESEPVSAVLAPDELPDLPAFQLVLTADELAAQGRYKEAVRERLRAIVRQLIEHELLEHRPGWTVTELTARASAAHPPLAEPLTAASDRFSGIWYGRLPAGPADDAAMRECANAVTALLATGSKARQVKA